MAVGDRFLFRSDGSGLELCVDRCIMMYHLSMILPTYPGKIPETFPNPKKKEFLHKLLVKHPGYLPGVCGRDLRIYQAGLILLPFGILDPLFDTARFVALPVSADGESK